MVLASQILLDQARRLRLVIESLFGLACFGSSVLGWTGTTGYRFSLTVPLSIVYFRFLSFRSPGYVCLICHGLARQTPVVGAILLRLNTLRTVPQNRRQRGKLSD